MDINNLNSLNDALVYCKKAIGVSSVEFWDHLSKGNNGFVYFLLKNDDIVYIGASQNRFRIGQHAKSKDFDSVYFYICQDFNILETELIKKFKTKYNRCKISIFYHTKH